MDGMILRTETKMSNPVVERRVFMGIGDAVRRLIHVERMYADGVDPGEQLVAESLLIVEALNQQYQLDLGMDCDLDGIPDSIDNDITAITHAAQTSCCRIKTDDSSSRSSRKASESPKTDSLGESAPNMEPIKKGFFSSLFGSEGDK